MARPRAPHGTYAAYRRHLAEKTDPCADCIAARIAYNRNRSLSRAARAENERRRNETLGVVAHIRDRVAFTAAEERSDDDADDLDDDVSRLDVLREMLAQSRKLIPTLMETDPARAYLQLREQREIIREIADIQSAGEKKGSTLAEQLAEARAERARRSAGA